MNGLGGRALGRRLCGSVALAASALALSAGSAGAVPAFAAQTGQACNACHIGGFGPELTPFGRNFKAGGYTLRVTKWNVPLSAMAVASYVHTQKDQAGGAAPGYSANDNVTLDQASVFVAGNIGSHFGAFIQTTYDGVAKAFHWDNTDIRAVTTTSVKGNSVILGASLNNAPAVEDPFNTLVAWGFPYTSSSLAPGAPAAPIIGAYAQEAIGLTGYAWINSSIYLEAGGYQSPGINFLRRGGVDPFSPGDISGTAPYARIAFQKVMGDKNFEVGAFGFWADLYPGRDRSAGATDHYADTGVDASFQYFLADHDVITVNGRWVHEDETFNASFPLGLSTNRNDSMDELRGQVSYYWRDKIGLTVAPFYITGSADSLLYGSRTGKPDTTGVFLQLDGTPWGASNSPLGRRFNLRLGLQYVIYNRFAGSSHNYDGAGANASDNNTLRAFAWVAF
ncbi:MAG TPA: hypothetical protein VGS12_15360 [Caulobacteraceae bacterium]|nr:hypothetical protein [Caulobacteraceae bacterium]